MLHKVVLYVLNDKIIFVEHNRTLRFKRYFFYNFGFKTVMCVLGRVSPISYTKDNIALWFPKQGISIAMSYSCLTHETSSGIRSAFLVH